MGAEDRKYTLFPNMEEVQEKTGELIFLLKQTRDFRRYEKHLAALKAMPEVYRELNAFRKENLQLQVFDRDEHYYEKTEALQTQYKNILMESVVMNFLTSEQRVCKMMQKVYDQIAMEMCLDVSYMDEE